MSKLLPTVLFDKSFLQGMSVDQSVWFDHFFMLVVSPLFYAETLSDLKKESCPRPTDVEVSIIAQKFPEMNGTPCAYHFDLYLNNLLGLPIPMDSRVPRLGGRLVKNDGKSGTVYNDAPEAQAFLRWTNKEFMSLEYDFAERWRRQTFDLDLIYTGLALCDVDYKSCKTLDDAKDVAEFLANQIDKPFEKMKFALDVLQIPHELYTKIFECWKLKGYPAFSGYAPYAAHVFKIRLFFAIGLAAGLIKTDRSSWLDICYLYYLPFCSVFVSSDKLHRRCAPLFLKGNQRFVWGLDLKKDLEIIDAHYKSLPSELVEKGIHFFAKSFPQELKLNLKEIWVSYSSKQNFNQSSDDRSINQRESARILEEIKKMRNAPSLTQDSIDFDPHNTDTLCVERAVHLKKGSWYQIPKSSKN